mmetsp:Transcript_26201/g.29425  ORF Transcript_26201/g.29425 Transcript_26201/m.29425 type:complete len:383 (-) Transcript_26201:5183-6331(-)|eukprot:CAMPEP_0170773450 /NCGR_PEP_ID=MMETSP0733-20121128/9382_1 /TAXON_ID=186038 /ORGANISM="Fragilariopsis kerguelensis, Strain L26-C5" /LENGTH=382 /DNA_ID=CAMNT_0011115843 /DNA_START=228 /DNA_END=1376 /DNA_ORIENTATION=+
MSSSSSSSSTNTHSTVNSGAVGASRGLHYLIEHAKNDVNCKKNPPCLSHYRVIPDNVKTAYDLLQQGAQLVRATSTKYALIGAIDRKEQTTLGNDLLRGCELIGAATHVTIQDSSGCSRAVRQYNQKAALSVYFATLRLVEAFHPEIRKSSSTVTKTPIVVIAMASASAENNVGAQKTGAVWEACDHILNKHIPQGNRNAIRREIFTWTRECNDTMEEFQEMVDLGPREVAQDDGINNDDFVDEQYTDDELPIAIACLGLVKISRGNMKVSLETLESIGGKSNETQDNDYYLESISEVHEYARKVGVGITDLGSAMYPPLISSKNILENEIRKQAACIKKSLDYILELENIPTKISELAKTLRNATETRENDFISALKSFCT